MIPIDPEFTATVAAQPISDALLTILTRAKGNLSQLHAEIAAQNLSFDDTISETLESVAANALALYALCLNIEKHGMQDTERSNEIISHLVDLYGGDEYSSTLMCEWNLLHDERYHSLIQDITGYSLIILREIFEESTSDIRRIYGVNDSREAIIRMYNATHPPIAQESGSLQWTAA